MQLDDTVKTVSLETTIMLSKAMEMFIREITLRGWRHTEDEHRRTLKKNDISEAVAGYDQFDFLIDIVPKPEAKKGIKKTQIKTSTNPKQVIITTLVVSTTYCVLRKIRSNNILYCNVFHSLIIIE